MTAPMKTHFCTQLVIHSCLSSALLYSHYNLWFNRIYLSLVVINTTFDTKCNNYKLVSKRADYKCE